MSNNEFLRYKYFIFHCLLEFVFQEIASFFAFFFRIVRGIQSCLLGKAYQVLRIMHIKAI